MKRYLVFFLAVACFGQYPAATPQSGASLPACAQVPSFFLKTGTGAGLYRCTTAGTSVTAVWVKIAEEDANGDLAIGGTSLQLGGKVKLVSDGDDGLYIKTSGDVVLFHVDKNGWVESGDGTRPYALSAVPAAFASGDAASRPASPASPEYYMATDTHELSLWNGTAWSAALNTGMWATIMNTTAGQFQVYDTVANNGVLLTASADDTAYNATTWDGSTKPPTQNAVRDKFEALGDAAAKNTGTTAGTVAAGDDSRFTQPCSVSITFTGAEIADGKTAIGIVGVPNCHFTKITMNSAPAALGATLDISKATQAQWDGGASGGTDMVGSGVHPVIATTKAQDVDITDWASVDVAEDDVVVVTLSSVTVGSATKLVVLLKGTR